MKILLAIDSSSASRVAVDQVAARPWPANTQVMVLTAVDTREPFALSVIVEEINTRARQLVDKAVRQLRSAGLTAETIVGQGDPKHVILDQAAALEADLIVLGAHGHNAVERFLLGSVSRSVLHHGHCSVELIRPFQAGQAFKVLLAVDGSAGSRTATELLAARPWPATAEFRVLGAVELGLSAIQGAFEIPVLDEKHLEEQRAAAMQRTEEAVDAAREILEAAGLRSSPSISVLAASPKEIILQEAAAWPADWIILGSHGNNGFDRFLIGSTSDAVATHATCSVAVMRAPGKPA
jgi:nucleotide-binding universal stress UspA family protein